MTADKRGLIENLRERIADSRGLNDDDREVLLRFSERLDILGKAEYSDHRHEKLLRHLTRMGEEVGGLADTLTDRDAAERIVAWINTTYDNPETNRDYRVALRVFGKRLVEGDPNVDPDTLKDDVPESIAWVSAKTPKNYQPTPRAADMLDWDDDVLPMIETGAANSRDRALFAVAFEGGFRSGELYALTVSDVSDHQYGKLIHVNGKTGERDVLIAGDAIAYLNDWLNDHPAKDDPDAPLWSRLTRPERASEQTFLKYFKRAAARVGVTKPVTPTNFRKSNATYLAKRGLNAAHIEDRQGRERGSKAVARYIAKFGTEADDEFVSKIHGMEVAEADEEDRSPKECHRCGELSPHHREACMKCGLPFDPLAAYDAGTKASKQANMDEFQSMVQAEVSKILGDMNTDRDGVDRSDSDSSRSRRDASA